MKIAEVVQFRNFNETNINWWNKLYNQHGSVAETICVLEAYLTQQERKGRLTKSEQLASLEVANLQGDEPVVGNEYYGVSVSAIGERVLILANFLGTLIEIKDSSVVIQFIDNSLTEYPYNYIGDMVVNTLLFADKLDYESFLTFAIIKYDLTIPSLDESGDKLDTLELPDIKVGDEVMVGKFKNRKATVKGFDRDQHNQPVLKTSKGDQKLFKPRISKLMPTSKKETE